MVRGGRGAYITPMPRPALPRGATTVALLLGAALALAAGCSGGGPARPEHPVVVIGIDGLEPRIVAELLERGRMPNLARFADEGVVGRIDTFEPTFSPVIWTSIATGQTLAEHGIVHFHDEDGLPFTSNARRVPALWNLVSDAGVEVNCVGWWATWPAEPVLGRMVASYAAQAQAQLIWKAPGMWEELEEQTHPAALADEIEPRVVFASDAEGVLDRLWQTFPRPPELTPVLEKSVTDLGWSYAADLTFAAVGAYLMERHPADLSLVYLALPDVAGHRFWKHYEPERYRYAIDPVEQAAFADYLLRAYEETDRLLGELLVAAPVDANVLVVSDHGMHAYEPALDDPEQGTTGHHFDAPPGVFAALGPEVRAAGNLVGDPRRGRLGHVLEVAPLVLHLLGLPVPEHWPAARAGVELLRVVEPAWMRAHPLRLGPNRDDEFRPATPPRLPRAGLDDEFREFFGDLGYLVSEGE